MHSFFDNSGVLSVNDKDSSDLRERIFNEVGSRPQDLDTAVVLARKAVEKTVHGLPPTSMETTRAERDYFERFLAKKKSSAHDEVNNILTKFSPNLGDFRENFRLLTRELLLKPTGVSQAEADFAIFQASSQLKIKGCHAIAFNPETSLYQFYSKAHEHAAREWFTKADEAERERLKKADEAERERLKKQWFGIRRFFMKTRGESPPASSTRDSL